MSRERQIYDLDKIGLNLIQVRLFMIMRIQKFLYIGLVMLSIPSLAAEFSADSRVITPNTTSIGKFFFADDKWRLEERLPGDEYRVTIFRRDRRCLYVIWPVKKRYIIQPLSETDLKIISTRTPGKEIERREIGHEKVAGYHTVKYFVKYKIQERIITNIEWFAGSLGVVIKSQSEGASWQTEFTNIHEGKQDETLFEIPRDFQELSFRDVFIIR